MLKKILISFLFISTNSFATCLINSPVINFGIYNPLINQEKISSSSFNITCDTLTTYSLKILPDNGNIVQNRKLPNNKLNSSDFLYYNIFLNTNRTIIFGDGSAGSSIYTGSDNNVPIYAHIPARQNVGIGTYSNTLSVELTF